MQISVYMGDTETEQDPPAMSFACLLSVEKL